MFVRLTQRVFFFVFKLHIEFFFLNKKGIFSKDNKNQFKKSFVSLLLGLLRFSDVYNHQQVNWKLKKKKNTHTEYKFTPNCESTDLTQTTTVARSFSPPTTIVLSSLTTTTSFNLPPTVIWFLSRTWRLWVKEKKAFFFFKEISCIK